jgi:hypothetical protein
MFTSVQQRAFRNIESVKCINQTCIVIQRDVRLSACMALFAAINAALMSQLKVSDRVKALQKWTLLKFSCFNLFSSRV